MVSDDNDQIYTYVAVFEHRFGIDTALFRARANSVDISDVGKLFSGDYEGHTELCEFGNIREVCDFEDHREDEFLNFDLIDIKDIIMLGEDNEQTSEASV